MERRWEFLPFPFFSPFLRGQGWEFPPFPFFPLLSEAKVHVPAVSPQPW